MMIADTEAYRSGHNGPDSKSGSPHGLVGSNPTASAIEKEDTSTGIFFFYYNKSAEAVGFEGDRAEREARSRFERRSKQSGGLF